VERPAQRRLTAKAAYRAQSPPRRRVTSCTTRDAEEIAKLLAMLP
jgi:hypothetical protein